MSLPREVHNSEHQTLAGVTGQTVEKTYCLELRDSEGSGKVYLTCSYKECTRTSVLCSKRGQWSSQKMAHSSLMSPTGGPQSRKTIQKMVAIATMTTTMIAVVVIILLLKPEGKDHFHVAIWNASPVLGTQSH